jgi:hypothetical protein
MFSEADAPTRVTVRRTASPTAAISAAGSVFFFFLLSGSRKYSAVFPTPN